MWGEIELSASGRASLEVYPKPDGQPWRFDLKEAQDVMLRAVRRLSEMAPLR
jgi:hypothetical protein